MSKENIGREPRTPNKTPEHPRDIAELAALVVSGLPPLEPGDSGSLIIFVWRDRTMTIKFPSGRRIYAHSRRGRSLDSIIHTTAVEAIRTYCQSVGIAGAEIQVHKVPQRRALVSGSLPGSSLFQAFRSHFSHPRRSASADPFRRSARPADAENPSCQ